MVHSSEIRFASDHPTAPGHFPGNPIIPGVLLLDEVVKAVAGLPDGAGEIVIRSAKFFRPVRPGEGVRLLWQPAATGMIRFECRTLEDDALAVAGTIKIGARPL
jgi:3-hydroxyacyl-[acyl-carrier-protein] dehydratase